MHDDNKLFTFVTFRICGWYALASALAIAKRKKNKSGHRSVQTLTHTHTHKQVLKEEQAGKKCGCSWNILEALLRSVCESEHINTITSSLYTFLRLAFDTAYVAFACVCVCILYMLRACTLRLARDEQAIWFDTHTWNSCVLRTRAPICTTCRTILVVCNAPCCRNCMRFLCFGSVLPW